MTEALSHLVGDYIVQSHWQADMKTKETLPAALHAVTYTTCFLPVTRNWKALAVIGGTHFVIDRFRLARHLVWAKNQVAPRSHRPPHTATGYPEDLPPWMSFWLMIIADNTTHLVINRLALKWWKETS